MKRLILLIVSILALAGGAARAEQRAGRASLLPADAAVAISGDSITEQKKYSVYIEDYLLMCQASRPSRVCQFGWSGEQAGGFLARMVNDVGWFSPTVATTCYGMNDGGYAPINPQTSANYYQNLTGIVQTFKKNHLALIVVGSPGAVDVDNYRDPTYNQTLAALTTIAQKVATEQHVVFADVHTPMFDAMRLAKAKYGKQYNVGGDDGIHPHNNGHLIMAYAFLKAMGFDGNIGSITVDLAATKATASDGHKIISFANGAVEVESSRYPFCFFGRPENPEATAGIIAFFPFNQDLNRFTLIVKGAKAAKYKVTWGAGTKEFSAADLGKGINLAAEFLDNPFAAPFTKVEQAIQKQQELETPMVKNVIHNHAPSAQQEQEKQQDRDSFKAAAATVEPVRHTITIEAVGSSQ